MEPKTEDTVRRAQPSKTSKRNWKPILLDTALFIAKSFAAGVASAAGGVVLTTVVRRSRGKVVPFPVPNRMTN